MLKRNIAILTLNIFIIVLLTACTRSIKYVIGNEPNFVGKVEMITENYVVVNVNDDDPNCKNYPIIHASLDVEFQDSYLDFSLGDEIVVYYDGVITSSDPSRVEKVYAITMRTPAIRENSIQD